MGTVSLFPNSLVAVDRVVELRIVIVEVPMWDVDSLDTASRLFLEGYAPPKAARKFFDAF